MKKKFNTVKEVQSWKDFKLNDKIYDLSHLNAHQVEYIDNRDENNPIIYKFIVTYGFHCFTKELKELSPEESNLLMYHAPKESRHFNIERYYLSKNLPNIVKNLSKKTTLVFHAGYNKYASVKVLDLEGKEVDYFVAFTVFREQKKLRLHIHSAYVKDDGIGKIKKVSFFTIAYNLLKGKKLPTP